VETTKKTSTTKAALLVLAALSMLLSGLFIATASRSDANPPPACPDGFSLTADAKNCFQAAVVTSADNPNSCDTGVLTPDGTKCYVNARVIPQEGKTLCPAGFSPDDSLGAMCARFEPASQNAPGCPTGSRGIAGSCYILVAKGPAGAATCDEGTLVGTNCVVTGAAPVAGESTCPESDVVFEVDGQCFTIVNRLVADAADCTAPYAIINTATMRCKVVTDGTIGFTCPDAPGTILPESVTHPNGTTKIAFCIQTPPTGLGDCPANTTPAPSGNDCRSPFNRRAGAPICATGFGLVDGKCIRYEAPATAVASCPIGSIEDGVGDCRKPVADSTGTFFCKDSNAALNGKSCVFTAGFLINPAPTLYKCDAGTRTVIGSGSASEGAGSTVQVICILGDANANTTSGPSCLQGVLSTDNLYCIVPRIDTAPAAAVAAPVPSFTG